MIIFALYDHVAKHKKISALALAKHFDLSIDGVEAMMSIWIKKGKIAKIVEKEQQTTKISYRLATKNELALTVIM